MTQTYVDSTGKDTGIVLNRPEPTMYTMVQGTRIKNWCGFGTKCPHRCLYLSHIDVLQRAFHTED